jgi:TrmH family RNA methyltransferase
MMQRQSDSTNMTRLRAVSSRQNALVKQLRRAFAQSEATDDGSVAVEGVTLVEEALRSQRPLRALFVSESGVARAEALLAALPAGVEALLLPDDVFHSAVASQTPQGVAALVMPLESTLEGLFPAASGDGAGAAFACAELAEAGLADLGLTELAIAEADHAAAGLASARRAGSARKAIPLILGCAGLQDPGNLGTILRSAEAFGATGVVCTEGTVSAANPKVARASAGSVFRLPCVRTSTAEAVAALRKHHVRLAVTSSHGGRALHECDLRGAVAIFIGNEGQGVPEALMAAADERIAIPHSTQVESLNAGIAASILLYEAWRQRAR